MNISKFKSLIIFIVILLSVILSYLFFFRTENQPENQPFIKKVIKNEPSIESELQKEDIINILLVGNDIGKERKQKGQTGYNTDTIILLSINPKENRAILTSFPRDIWQNNSKINSILITQGMDSLLNAISKISGQEINKFVTIDFDGIRWLVDAFGGVPVEIETSFTDNTFPNNFDTGIMSVSFVSGVEVMTGERALTFARSRKGNNGEGSDLMRAKRQHRILKGMTKAVENNNSKFFPFNIKEFYEEVVLNTKTNLSLEDATYLYSFYKNLESYQIESLVLDDRYIFHPGISSSYGGSWVFVAKDRDFKKLHTDLNSFLIEGVSPNNVQN
jgi:LCP family protein required for cell wall assembly